MPTDAFIAPVESSAREFVARCLWLRYLMHTRLSESDAKRFAVNTPFIKWPVQFKFCGADGRFHYTQKERTIP